MKRGSGAYLESKVDLLPAGDIDDDPTLRIKFKNTKIQRELGLDNFSKEYDELVDKFKAQKETGFPTLYEYLCDLYGVDYNEFKKRKRAVKQESYTEFYEDEEDNVPTLKELRRMIIGEEGFDESFRINEDNPYEKEWEEYRNGTKGSFMKHLANAFQQADTKNLEKLESAFPQVAKKFCLWKSNGKADNVAALLK